MSQTMYQSNWKPIKAALMTYYTRPIMWIPIAIILIASLIGFASYRKWQNMEWGAKG